ncbi:Uncharacterized protein T4C_1026 [Trichinella pseudospiralis]|uniref:SCAN domain-containing protein 3 n=1 Tax=Trichinella pseudospiralis TaxID=6337 RepID=A0A0V1JKX7_TRIPS|nr:Uncharacterized protein T4C_1026 [Trichinella pseudospiralis]
MPLENFWVKLQAEYPKISSQSLRILVPFISSYLCETVFSSFMALNTQHQNRNILLWKLPWLNATMKQRVALRTLNTYYNKEEACADTDPCLFTLWVPIGSELHNVRLQVPRIFYVSQRAGIVT